MNLARSLHFAQFIPMEIGTAVGKSDSPTTSYFVSRVINHAGINANAANPAAYR